MMGAPLPVRLLSGGVTIRILIIFLFFSFFTYEEGLSRLGKNRVVVTRRQCFFFLFYLSVASSRRDQSILLNMLSCDLWLCFWHIRVGAVEECSWAVVDSRVLLKEITDLHTLVI